VPVLPVLEEWLTAELVAYQKLDPAARKGAGYLVNYYGSQVLNVKRAWQSMLVELKLPKGASGSRICCATASRRSCATAAS
jgi:hypothetical protein